MRAGINPPGDANNGMSGTWGQLFDLTNFSAAPDNLSLDLANSWTDYQIRIWPLAPDASLREHFILDDPQPGLLPKFALLPGKVAITWVRPGVNRSRTLGAGLTLAAFESPAARAP